MSLFLCPSACLSVSLCPYSCPFLSIALSVCQSICLYPSLSLYPSHYLSLSLSVSLILPDLFCSLTLFVCLSVCVCLYPSLRLCPMYFHVCLCLSVYASVFIPPSPLGKSLSVATPHTSCLLLREQTNWPTYALHLSPTSLPPHHSHFTFS